jgi:hypothetical protein
MQLRKNRSCQKQRREGNIGNRSIIDSSRQKIDERNDPHQKEQADYSSLPNPDAKSSERQSCGRCHRK